LGGPYWDLTAHVRGALGEALVAEAIHQRYPDALLHIPRHPGYDVSTDEGGLRVDAKAASILDVDLDGSGLVAAVEWNAGGRRELLHEEATHLGLVVFDEALTLLKLYEGQGVVLRGDVAAHGRVFVVPKSDAVEMARPIWSTRYRRPSRGRFRYLRLEWIERYELKFRTS